MYSQLTPFLAGKLDGLAHRKRKCPYEDGSQDANDYASGYERGRSIEEGENADLDKAAS